jgi:hypothetical protein
LFRLLLQSPAYRDQATKALAELERMKQQAPGAGPTSP